MSDARAICSYLLVLVVLMAIAVGILWSINTTLGGIRGELQATHQLSQEYDPYIEPSLPYLEPSLPWENPPHWH